MVNLQSGADRWHTFFFFPVLGKTLSFWLFQKIQNTYSYTRSPGFWISRLKIKSCVCLWVWGGGGGVGAGWGQIARSVIG